MWSSGDAVLFRWLPQRRVSRVWPMIVVEDSAEVVALFIRRGAPTKVRVRPDGSPLDHSVRYAERFHSPWRLGDGRWHGHDMLMLTRPHAEHAFWAFYGDDGALAAWYVNLQAPLRRTRLGFDSEDHVLDITIAPDLSWSWKDEDELAEAVRIGRFSAAEAAKIRREGERVVAAIEARTWPLGSGWETWKPNPSWPRPTLPDDDAYLR